MFIGGLGTVVDIELAMVWTVLGSNYVGGKIFHTCPDQTWGQPSLLWNGYWVFPRGKEQELVSRIRMFYPDPARKLSANLYDICHCCVYSEKLLIMDRGTVQNM
jgi:hypothetical protein